MPELLDISISIPLARHFVHTEGVTAGRLIPAGSESALKAAIGLLDLPDFPQGDGIRGSWRLEEAATFDEEGWLPVSYVVNLTEEEAASIPADPTKFRRTAPKIKSFPGRVCVLWTNEGYKTEWQVETGYGSLVQTGHFPGSMYPMVRIA